MSRSLLPRMRNDWDKICRRNQNTYSVFNNIFVFRKYRFYEMMWKTFLEPERPQMTRVSHAQCMVITKATHTRTHTHTHTHLLTPWCRVLLGKLTGLQLVQKFPAFYGTQRLITALTGLRHPSLSWASPIQSINPHPTHTHTHTHTERIYYTYCFSTATMTARASVCVKHTLLVWLLLIVLWHRLVNTESPLQLLLRVELRSQQRVPFFFVKPLQ